MFPLRKDDLSSLKCLLLLMIDPHSPIVSQDSQAGPGTWDGGTKDGHSQIKTPDSSVAPAGPTLVLQSTEQIIHISDNPWLVRPSAQACTF